MSKETNRRVIDTTPEQCPAFVRIVGRPDLPATLILQRYLLTKIETTINRDEALALAQGLIEHFEIMPKEVAAGLPIGQVERRAVPSNITIVIVHGPKGCGKTRYRDLLKKHFHADLVSELASEAKMWSTLKQFSESNDRTMVLLTNRTGAQLDILASRFGTAEVIVVAFENAIRGARKFCAHNWQRQVCADIHQPDYFVCTECGEQK